MHTEGLSTSRLAKFPLIGAQKKCKGLYLLNCGQIEKVKPTASGLYGLKAKIVKLYKDVICDY